MALVKLDCMQIRRKLRNLLLVEQERHVIPAVDELWYNHTNQKIWETRLEQRIVSARAWWRKSMTPF